MFAIHRVFNHWSLGAKIKITWHTSSSPCARMLATLTDKNHQKTINWWECLQNTVYPCVPFMRHQLLNTERHSPWVCFLVILINLLPMLLVLSTSRCKYKPLWRDQADSQEPKGRSYCQSPEQVLVKVSFEGFIGNLADAQFLWLYLCINCRRVLSQGKFKIDK